MPCEEARGGSAPRDLPPGESGSKPESEDEKSMVQTLKSKIRLKVRPCVWTQSRLSAALGSKPFQSAPGRLQFDPIFDLRDFI